MPDAKTRRWFQLHLSTLVVLALVAGALVWANVSSEPKFQEERIAWYYGWPINLVAYGQTKKWELTFLRNNLDSDGSSYAFVRNDIASVSKFALFVSLDTAMAATAVVAALSETIIRRRMERLRIALLMVTSAAIMVLVNTRVRWSFEHVDSYGDCDAIGYGWPRMFAFAELIFGDYRDCWSTPALLIDIGVALVVVAVVGLFSSLVGSSAKDSPKEIHAPLPR